MHEHVNRELSCEHKQQLMAIPLFRDLPSAIKDTLLDVLDYKLRHVRRGDVVATQGASCQHMFILLSGLLRTDIIDGLGNEVLIEHIVAPRTFATPHLFSADNTLPATFTALEDSVVLMATKDSTLQLLRQDPLILRNFFRIVGNCNHCTVTRLKLLSRKTVRERFVVYLFHHLSKNSDVVTVAHTQSQLAEYLNVSRPALSKEINKLVKEGLIKTSGKEFTVLQRNVLERYQ